MAIGAGGGDVWWRKAEKASIRYMWAREVATTNVNDGGGGGNEGTGAVWIEFFDYVNFHKVFQRRGEHDEEQARMAVDT